MPVSPSGLPGATRRPWSRCTSRTTASSASGAEDPVQVRQRVLAGGRVEQVRAGQVAQPVAQRDQSAQRPDVRRRQGDERVGRAQRRGGHVQHQVVRADRDDRALDVGQPAQQLHPDPLAGVVALHPGRHHQQAVRADQRGQHAGRARQRASPRCRRRRCPAGPGPSRRSRWPRPACGPAGRWSPAAPAGPHPRARPASARRRCRRSARPRPGSRGRPDRVAGIGVAGSPATVPSTTGCPGRTATPCTASEPAAATTRAV